jgi:transposase InsO family protein
VVPAVATVWRILTRRGFVVLQPHKRPKTSWHRFASEQPNERWQADTTHWQLADGIEVEILNIIDDHSRLALASLPRRTITGPDVLHTFQDAFLRWGIPASVLTEYVPRNIFGFLCPAPLCGRVGWTVSSAGVA